VGRQAPADLDREFRAHGIASIIAAPVGGIATSLQIGTSRLLEHAGGANRISGVACAMILGVVGLCFDLRAGSDPVLYLGYTFLVEALWRPYAQRAWSDLILAVGIMLLCVNYGFLVGVLAGIVCACVLFAISCARRGVVRRHLTRANFASYVERSEEALSNLTENGDVIQIYWLTGYIFFGSWERLFDRIRRH
jgi:SulP family sulfate permease